MLFVIQNSPNYAHPDALETRIGASTIQLVRLSNRFFCYDKVDFVMFHSHKLPKLASRAGASSYRRGAVSYNDDDAGFVACDFPGGISRCSSIALSASNFSPVSATASFICCKSRSISPISSLIGFFTASNSYGTRWRDCQSRLSRAWQKAHPRRSNLRR